MARLDSAGKRINLAVGTSFVIIIALLGLLTLWPSNSIETTTGIAPTLTPSTQLPSPPTPFTTIPVYNEDCEYVGPGGISVAMAGLLRRNGGGFVYGLYGEMNTNPDGKWYYYNDHNSPYRAVTTLDALQMHKVPAGSRFCLTPGTRK